MNMLTVSQTRLLFLATSLVAALGMDDITNIVEKRLVTDDVTQNPQDIDPKRKLLGENFYPICQTLGDADKIKYEKFVATLRGAPPKKGDVVFSLFFFQTKNGDRVPVGTQGTVMGPVDDGGPGDLFVNFEGVKWEVYLKQISKERPSTLPGGYKEGETVYNLQALTGYASGRKTEYIVHWGDTGTVKGPSKINGKVKVEFDNGGGIIWHLYLAQISRVAPSDTRGTILGSEPSKATTVLDHLQEITSANRTVQNVSQPVPENVKDDAGTGMLNPLLMGTMGIHFPMSEED